MADHLLYALVAAFDDEKAIKRAAERAYAEGYRKLDAYTPFPVHGLGNAIGERGTLIRWIVLAGGLAGLGGGAMLQVYTQAMAYPHNVGGRPPLSWPAFIPVTFELTILLAALFGFFGLLVLNRLPQPHHPIFNTPGFERASRDRFFLSIEAADPKFDPQATRRFLEELGAAEINEAHMDRLDA
ncbi:MAG: DUF3341 domain-containing protein [Oscillochloris sp.]|nr:DUF3341 domain-containing protein [Oscillochloris sp.]